MSDADETERIPLHEGVGVNSPSMAARRWPMLLLGAVVGLLSAAAIGGLGGKPLLGSAAIETTCGAVPTITHPPLVRRTLDATVRNVLVTGGAGFIASHFALALLDRGNYNVTIVDDLSRGSIDTVPSLAPASRPQPHAPAATALPPSPPQPPPPPLPPASAAASLRPQPLSRPSLQPRPRPSPHLHLHPSPPSPQPSALNLALTPPLTLNLPLAGAAPADPRQGEGAAAPVGAHGRGPAGTTKGASNPLPHLDPDPDDPSLTLTLTRPLAPHPHPHPHPSRTPEPDH